MWEHNRKTKIWSQKVIQKEKKEVDDGEVANRGRRYIEEEEEEEVLY